RPGRRGGGDGSRRGGSRLRRRARPGALRGGTGRAGRGAEAVGGAGGRRELKLGAAEAFEQPLGVPVLPALLAGLGGVVAVELDELVDEVASDGCLAEQLRQLRVIEQPVGVPRR